MKKQIDLGTIFLSGIGGIGMSAIAEILCHLGCDVQGSDQAFNANIERLEKLGVKVFIGQKEENIQEASVIVRSSAIRDDNPELVAARAKQIPILERADMLARIMDLKKCVSIAGAHGKTTTTSMLAGLFAETMPGTTVINGGILNSCNSNAYFGDGEWLIAEADESDGSFLKLPSQIAIVTNIDPEHLDHYGSFANLKAAFKEFMTKVPEDGCVIYGSDCEHLETIINTISHANLLSYGFAKNANIRGVNIKATENGYNFDVEHNLNGNSEILYNIDLPMFGLHNVQNALATIAVAYSLGFPETKIISSLGKFLGVKRRLTVTGEVNDITIIDDYAHHPEEIKASIRAASEMKQAKGKQGKVVAILQPHRYSRVASLFAEFSASILEADLVFLGDIFAAGESPVAGVSQETLGKAMEKSGQQNLKLIDDWDNLDRLLKNYLAEGDIVIFLGAGNVTKYANELPAKLKKLF